MWAEKVEEEFQFPSNGKVYSKQCQLNRKNRIYRFNSLQTGKCIASHAFEQDRL